MCEIGLNLPKILVFLSTCAPFSILLAEKIYERSVMSFNFKAQCALDELKMSKINFGSLISKVMSLLAHLYERTRTLWASILNLMGFKRRMIDIEKKFFCKTYKNENFSNFHSKLAKNVNITNQNLGIRKN